MYALRSPCKAMIAKKRHAALKRESSESLRRYNALDSDEPIGHNANQSQVLSKQIGDSVAVSDKA